MIRELLLGDDNPTNVFIFWGRVAIFLGFTLWGFHFIANASDVMVTGSSFLHNIDLVFHEAGHILFIPLGRFMSILGGSLMQILVPAIFAVHFLFWRRNPYATSIMTWWVGQNFIDLAPYIGDARGRKLMLLGGITGQDHAGMHDWFNILNSLDLLAWDMKLAAAARVIGSAVIILSLVWAGVVLFRQFQNLE
jgi:hypothetical protein